MIDLWNPSNNSRRGSPPRKNSLPPPLSPPPEIIPPAPAIPPAIPPPIIPPAPGPPTPTTPNPRHVGLSASRPELPAPSQENSPPSNSPRTPGPPLTLAAPLPESRDRSHSVRPRRARSLDNPPPPKQRPHRHPSASSGVPVLPAVIGAPRTSQPAAAPQPGRSRPARRGPPPHRAGEPARPHNRSSEKLELWRARPVSPQRGRNRPHSRRVERASRRLASLVECEFYEGAPRARPPQLGLSRVGVLADSIAL